jgi:AcrR family transcriptional regulator
MHKFVRWIPPCGGASRIVVGARASKKKVDKKKRKSTAMEARQTAYRGLVLEAAERVFAEKGFDGAKIKDVADAAGLALGTVYVLFPGKQEVFSAVHAQRGRALFETIAGAVDGAESPLAALRRMQRAAFEFYRQHPFYLRMHLYSGTAWAIPRLDVDEERHVFERGIGALEGLFAQAAARGELVDDRPETCAKMYLAMMQVLLSEWEAEGFVRTSAEMAERLETHVTRAFFRPDAAQPGAARRSA